MEQTHESWSNQRRGRVKHRLIHTGGDEQNTSVHTDKDRKWKVIHEVITYKIKKEIMKLRAQTMSRLSLCHTDVISVTFLGNEKNKVSLHM